MKYVVECTKRVRCEDVGLGHEGWYRTGQYVTYDGRPTRSLDKAFIYGSDSRSPGSDIDEFPFEDFPHLDDYFKKVPVSVVVRVTRKRPASRRSSTARIDWSPVNDNSSSVDAVASLARGDSMAECERMVWDPKVKAIFRKLRRLPVRKARELARGWCRRELLSY
jgi:hypothetical protein